MRGVTFDAAGTLLEVAEPVGVTYARTAGRHGVMCEPDVVEQRFRAAFASAPPLAFPGAPGSTSRAPERAWWHAIVAAALGPGIDAGVLNACFTELFDHYARASAWRVFPDAPPALRTLRGRGFRLAVVSNFDARLPYLLAELGLASAVDTIVHSTGVGFAKPDARIFTHAVRTLGVIAADCAHVGDDLVADVEGARAAGLRGILIVRRAAAPSSTPDVATIRSLGELPALLMP